jgi:hypothetical protein
MARGSVPVVIELERDGEVAVLRLAHGPVSAMDVELCDAVAAQFRALVTDPASAVVVTGTGRASPRAPTCAATSRRASPTPAGSSRP